jgi:hypothetical protein
MRRVSPFQDRSGRAMSAHGDEGREHDDAPGRGLERPGRRCGVGLPPPILGRDTKPDVLQPGTRSCLAGEARPRLRLVTPCRES